MRNILNVIATFSLLATASTSPVVVKVEDASGAPLKNELVIVQDLWKGEAEVFRGLSGDDGKVPPLQLSPGLYRAIAVAPYSAWKTEVREFLVRDKSSEVVLRVDPLPTHGYGDVVTVGTLWIDVQVTRADGRPAAGATILARDDAASLELERWYKVREDGSAHVEVVSEPLILVVVDGDSLLVKQISGKESKITIRLPG